MSTVELTLDQLHDAQWEVKLNRARFNTICAGRRFGKNILAKDVAIEELLNGYPVGWFEPTYKTLSEVWRDIKNTLAPVTRQKLEQEHRIETITGGVLDMWSLDNPDTSRGRKYKRVIINEAAVVANLGDIWNMIIRPMLADYKGDAWIFSTPKGRNYFWQMYQMGIDPNNSDWHSWQYPTSSNPYIPSTEVESMKHSMPERVYQQEIQAIFVEDAGGIFRRVMDAATSQELLSAIDGHQYIAGVDIATLVDYTVAVVIDVAEKRMVYMDRFNRVSYETLEDRLQALYRRFKLDSMVIESNSVGQPVIDALANRGMNIIPFTTTNITKQTAIQLLQAAFEHGNIRILNDPVLIGELQAFEGQRTPSGSWKYSAPENFHDDCVLALCIAWQAMEGGNLWLIS